VVFLPSWSVPLEIQREELVPKVAADPAFLARGGYEIRDRAGAPVAPGPAALDGLRSGALRLRQRPGPHNALGRVKPASPNAYGVYLHDTPAQELFARSRRDFSHGCVRVERPDELAAWALRDEPGWTPERVRAALAGTETVTVPLR
jgi:L,D-transpeptidase YcbB